MSEKTKKYPEIFLSKFEIERKTASHASLSECRGSTVRVEFLLFNHKTIGIDLSEHEKFLEDLKAFLAERNAQFT